MSTQTNPKTIVLISVAGRAEEALAGGAITPGDLVGLASTGKYIRNASVAVDVERAFAKENALKGDGITTDYAADERVFVHLAAPGDVIYANLAPGHATSIGSKLTSSVSGQLELAAATAGEPTLAIALEAATASGSKQRIKVRIL